MRNGVDMSFELQPVLRLAHAFRFVDRVVFHVGPLNRRSQRAMEKIGASSLGLRQHPVAGHAMVFEITRDTFISCLSSADV